MQKNNNKNKTKQKQNKTKQFFKNVIHFNWSDKNTFKRR